jgi:hypothetical protein
MKINDQSLITIPVKNLLALIAITAVSVWAYFGIEERLAFLEYNYGMLQVEVEENDTWIDDFQPPSQVLETVKRVRDLELKVRELEVKGQK